MACQILRFSCCRLPCRVVVLAMLFFFVAVVVPSCAAFMAPGHLVSQSYGTRRSTSVPLHAMPSSFHDTDLLSSLPVFAQSSLTLIANNDDISVDQAFQDSISFADSTVGILVAVFAVIAVLAVGLKTVMSEMDGAIEKVLVDFEASLKLYYPNRWDAIEKTSLAGLSGDEREVKLLKVMEDLQRDEPEFMKTLANRSGSGPGDAS